MKKIIIKTVPDSQQRYNTVGDYYLDENKNRIFVVSDMKNWKYEMLVAVHEIIESSLCRDRGITDQAIDDFDLTFEENRLTNTDVGEPGDSPDAPYHKEHQFATKIEMMLAKELGVDWDEYSSVCGILDDNTGVLKTPKK